MTAGRRSRLATAAEFGLFALSVGSFQGSRLTVSIAATTVLSPGEFGMWGLIVTVLGYSNFASLGVLNGANREIPIAVGAGDHGSAGAIERSSFGGALAAGAVAAGGCAALALIAGWTFALLAAVLFFQQTYLFFQVSLRSRIEFNRASAQQMVLSGLFLAIGMVAVSAGLAGLLVAQLAAFSAGSFMVFVLWRRTLRPSFDPTAIRRLIRTGLPIMFAGVAFAILATADRWVVALLLTPSDLGHYSLGALVASGMLLVSVIVGQQFYPRMAMAYGAGQSGRSLLSLATKQSGIALALTGPLALAVGMVSALAIPVLAVEYIPAISLIQVLSTALLPLAAAAGYTNLLVATGHSDAYLRLLLGAIGLQLVLGATAVALGTGPIGVACGAVVTYSIFATSAIWVSINRVRTQHE